MVNRETLKRETVTPCGGKTWKPEMGERVILKWVTGNPGNLKREYAKT